MKLGFNEATALKCKGQSLMADLEACEKHGYDYIEIRADCIKEYLKDHSLGELAAWFKNHRLKPWAYNTLEFFNLRDREGTKKIDAEIDFIIEAGNSTGMNMVNTVPSNPEYYRLSHDDNIRVAKEKALNLLPKYSYYG